MSIRHRQGAKIESVSSPHGTPRSDAWACHKGKTNKCNTPGRIYGRSPAIWLVYGLYMACIWLVYGLYMACIWPVYGLYMACIWLVYDLYMACIWLVYGLYMACIWLVYGLCMACIWLVYQVINHFLSGMHVTPHGVRIGQASIDWCCEHNQLGQI